jgi:RNA polymerase-binding transcription factor DksA
MQKFPNDILLQIKGALEEELESLSQKITELTRQDPFQNGDRVNDNAASDTEASEEADHDRVAALVDELKEKRGAITQALERISKGTYGFCAVCKRMIDTDRLSILPMATLCRTCEEKKKRTLQ